MNHLHREIKRMLAEQLEEMIQEDREEWLSEDSQGSSKYQQMVRNKRYQGYQGGGAHYALHLTPEYLDQVLPVITRFLEGKPGTKNYAEVQHWVDARKVITEVSYRIHHPEDQRFQEEDLEEIVYWTKGGTDQHIFTMGTVWASQEEDTTRRTQATKGKGKMHNHTLTNTVIKWNGED